MADRGMNATIVFLVLVVVAVVTTVGLLYTQLRTDEISTAVSNGEMLRLLVVADDDGEPFLSFVLFFQPETRRVAMLDIPGNVGAVLRSLGRVDSINRVFDPDDPSTFRAEVESLIGVEMTSTLVFSESGLIDFIDLLGGMELFIVTDYQSVDGPDAVMLPAGNVVLDGRKAVDYLRLQDGNESELERTGRRQAFVQSLLRAVKRNAALLQNPDVVPVRDRIVSSDLDRRARTSLFAALADMDAERLVRRRVQGTVRTVDVDGESTQLLFPHFEGQWLKQSVQQVEATLASTEQELDDQVLVSMEVLNGTTSAGLARRTSQLYEDFGFDVRRFGNADSNQIDHTLVIDRRGTGELAERVAQVIEAERVITEVAPDSDVDVTLILGRDFDGTVVRTEN